MEVLECVSKILDVASALYECYQEVKANQERCRRLVDRVQVVAEVVKDVTREDLDSELVRKALEALEGTLLAAVTLVGKHADTHWCVRAMKAGSLRDDFLDVNQQLSEVSERLSLCLQVEQVRRLKQVFEAQRREKEDQRDAELDHSQWQKVLPLLEGMDQKVDNMQIDLHDIKNLLQEERRANDWDTVDKIQKSHIDVAKSIKTYETSVSQYKTLIRAKFSKVQEYNSRPGSDYVVLSERYTELVMVQKHREQREREQEIRMRGRDLLKGVFTRASKEYHCIRLEQLFSPSSRGGEAPKAVILQGHSGYGKSFTSQKIMDDWASDRLYQDTFDLVFYLKVKELNNIKGNVCLVDVLLQHDEIDKAAVLKVLWEVPQRVLFLIDGFDELRLAPEDLNASLPYDPRDQAKVKVVLAALLKGKMLCKSSLLVTTRSTALKALSDMLKEPQRFTEILGFSDAGVESYFQAFFAKEEDPTVWRKALKHVKDNDTLLTACFIPVTCWIVCNVFKDVFKADTDMITGLDTSTSIFAHFVFTQMKHHGQDLEESQWNHLLRSLGQLAEDGITKQKVLFDEQDVKQLGWNHHLVPFLCQFFLRKLSVVTKYSFMHLSFQEFFAALFYVLSNAEVAREKVREVLDKVQQGLHVTNQKLHMSHMLPVIQFLFGLSNEEVTATHQLCFSPEIRSLLEDWILRLIREEEGLPRTHNIQLFILECLYEVHEEAFVRTAMEIWNCLNLDGIPLKKTDCSVVAYCVRHCQAMERLTLTHCNLTAEKLKVLTDALAKSAEIGLVVQELRDSDVDDLSRALGEDKIITDLHVKNSVLSLGSVWGVLDVLCSQRRVDSVHLSVRIPYQNAIIPIITSQPEEGEDVCGSWTETPPVGKPIGLDLSLERKILSTEQCKHTLTIGLMEKIAHLGPCVSEISINQSASSEHFSLDNTWTQLIETVHTLADRSVGGAEFMDGLQSSLLHVPDVKTVDLMLSCLTVDMAAKFLSFFQACPTLHSGKCKESENTEGWEETLCTDLSLRRTSASLQLNVKHPAGDVLSDITLTMATPSEGSDWTKVFQSLRCLSGSPDSVDVCFLRAVSGLQRVMLQLTSLTEQWATALLSLIHTPLNSTLEYCSLRVTESPCGPHGNSICSFLSVEKEDDIIMLVVECSRQPSLLRDAQITDLSLALPQAHTHTFSFHNILKLQDLDAGTPEFVEQVSSIQGLQKIKVTLRCLTESWAETLLSLIRDCPSLTIITVDAGEDGEGLLLEEGIQSLQDGLQTLKDSHSQPQLTLTLTGRHCGKNSNRCASPEEWEKNCNHRAQLQSCRLEPFTHTPLEPFTHTPLEPFTHTPLEPFIHTLLEKEHSWVGGDEEAGERVAEDEDEEEEDEEKEHRELMNTPQESPGAKCYPCRCELL